MTSRTYSAVVDPVRDFPAQAMRLVASLRDLAEVDPSDVLLHVVRRTDDLPLLRSLASSGATLIPVEPFPGNPWCNKLQQLESLLTRKTDDIVLLDCDTVVLEEPPRHLGCVAGKPVDFANPPLPVLQAVYDAARLDLQTRPADIDGALTAHGNVNGGVYVIDSSLLPRLAPAWRRWAQWCMRRRALFGAHWIHVDQVSFAMAVASEALPFRELDRRFNFPTHVAQPVELDRAPAVIHYHRMLDSQQFLLPVGLPLADAAINRVNAWAAGARRANFDNATFWNARYTLDPELGSGVGSRGEVKERKRALLTRVVSALEARRVVDVGGGDGQVSGCLPEDVEVIAHDLAATARELYLNEVPRATWSQLDVIREPVAEGADLVICLDLLIHLSDPESYRAAVRNLVRSGAPLLLTGFEERPEETGPMTYFHESLSTTLEALDVEPFTLDRYRGCVVLLALPRSGDRHGVDTRVATLLDARGSQ